MNCEVSVAVSYINIAKSNMTFKKDQTNVKKDSISRVRSGIDFKVSKLKGAQS